MKKTFYQQYGKKILDLSIGILLFIGVLPILVAAALMVLILTGRPILYFQVRIGKNGKKFFVYKFRSMTVSKNRIATQTRNRDPDVTWIGAILRRTKIDELPQLFNLIRGDLSLVGPRPCLPETVEAFDDNGKKRLEVVPGMTGLAQVNGNVELTWQERWVYDAKYVDEMSFWLDMKILAKTILIIIFGEEKFLRKPPILNLSSNENERKII